MNKVKNISGLANERQKVLVTKVTLRQPKLEGDFKNMTGQSKPGTKRGNCYVQVKIKGSSIIVHFWIDFFIGEKVSRTHDEDGSQRNQNACSIRNLQ